MERLLDYIIIPSLNAKTGQKFIAFINALKKSEDTTLNRMASDMTCNCVINSTTTNSTTTGNKIIATQAEILNQGMYYSS